MKRTIRKLLVIIICIAMCIVNIPANALSMSTQLNKLLFVVDQDYYDSFVAELNNPTVIFDTSKPNDYYSNTDTTESIGVNFGLFDWIASDVVTDDIISHYKAVALPKTANSISNLAKVAYKNGVLVYVYGNLTISEYKQIVGLEEFSINTRVYNSNETQSFGVKQWFDDLYERTEMFGVISHSSNPLLSKFSSEVKQVHCLAAATNNYEEIIESYNMRSTILTSEFDFVNYWGPNNEFSNHLDYTLYREMDELDATYDYLGIKTKVWVNCGSSKLYKIFTKYELPATADNLLETGPESQSNIGSLDVSCGYGDDAFNGSIGFSVDLSDIRPTIERTEDFTSDVVEWSMSARTWAPLSINNANLSCVATWASVSKVLAIDVSYKSIVKVGPQLQYPSESEYVKIPIRLSYSD